MLFFVFIPLFVCLFFALLSAKYNNPYTLTFIFGKKGSGKSTLMVKYMLKYLKKGWFVYTDMKDVHIPGVRFFNTMDLAIYAPPMKSVLFLDEGGITFDNRKYKSFPDGLRDFFALQRKYFTRVYINSQSFDIDVKLRQRTDAMILQSNIGNIIGISRPIRRKVTLVEASAQGESRIADNLKFGGITSWRFTWLPRYHRYFESFNAPPREPLKFEEIAGDIRDFRLSSALAIRKLKHHRNKDK